MVYCGTDLVYVVDMELGSTLSTSPTDPELPVTGLSITPAATPPELVDPSSSNIVPGPPNDTSSRALETLGQGHRQLQEDYRRCKADLSRVSANCLALENSRLTGLYP